jgi:predicted O-methyltransferase YrrM
VLLDLWKDLYRPCFELFHAKLAPGALVAADNMLFPPDTRPDAMQYQAFVRTKPDMDSILLHDRQRCGIEPQARRPVGIVS